MSGQSGKQVRAVVEIGPNYVFHLMAVARVGFDSEYADRYQGSVLPDDVAYIQKHKDQLTFGGGSSSELVGPIIVFPAYFNLNSKEMIQEHYDLLDVSLANDDYQPYLDRYKSHIKKLDKWWFTINEELLKQFLPYRNLILELGKIIVRNFDLYLDSVWVKERPRMDEVAESINSHFSISDRIGEWEAFTGMTFEFDEYNIVLTSAIKGGPNANSMGYDRVLFYSETQLDPMMQLISHEIGTHLLIGMLKDLSATEKFEWHSLYEGYECLARYYNTIILKDSPLDYSMSTFHVQEYLDIFGRIHTAEQKIKPHDLLVKGIELFQTESAAGSSS